ncbi:MAG TPA: metallophosphoesterase, partial [Humisphaera sp.]
MGLTPPANQSDLPTAVAVVGDVHGHLLLALCMAARWQRRLGVRFEAVLLCGDVGSFTEDAQLDNATRSHARDNPCELEFLRQWAVYPPPPWIAAVFEPEPAGLGLCCPVVMVHGNHDGFAHLRTLYSAKRRPAEPVPVDQLRGADAQEFVRYLPSGWRTVLPSGLVVGGVGGIQPGQRARVGYDPMAYIEDRAVEALLDAPPVDVLITHQGPAGVQGDHGSELLDLLLEAG